MKLPFVIIQQPGENADKGLALTRRQRCEQFILGVGQQGVEPPQVCPALSGDRNDVAAAVIRHFWGAELTYAPADPGQDHRGVGTLEPLWNLFDLTPEGRPMDWDEQLSYQ